MQQGAKSATIPARNEASMLPPKRAVVICDVGRSGRLRSSSDCNYEPVVILWLGCPSPPERHRWHLPSIYYLFVAVSTARRKLCFWEQQVGSTFLPFLAARSPWGS